MTRRTKRTAKKPAKKTAKPKKRATKKTTQPVKKATDPIAAKTLGDTKTTTTRLPSLSNGRRCLPRIRHARNTRCCPRCTHK